MCAPIGVRRKLTRKLLCAFICCLLCSSQEKCNFPNTKKHPFSGAIVVVRTSRTLCTGTHFPLVHTHTHTHTSPTLSHKSIMFYVQCELRCTIIYINNVFFLFTPKVLPGHPASSFSIPYPSTNSITTMTTD